MFTFQQVKSSFMPNNSSNHLDCHNSEAIAQGNHMGFRPIFPTGASQNALWFNPSMTYYIPTYQGMTPLTSPPITPNSSVQETASFNSDAWGFNYMNSPFNISQSNLFLDPAGHHQEAEAMIKEEEKSVSYETVNHLEPQPQLKTIIKQEEAKIQKKPKRKPIDKDYMPHRSQKKQTRKRLHQNENRNVIPNEINQIISFLQKRTKSEHVLKKIWEKCQPTNEEYSISRFYLYQNILKEKSGHYSNQKQLGLLSDLYEPECKIWSIDQQRHYITLSRMLVGHFLREDSIPIILTSKRMKSQKKLEHLKARREVTRRVLALMGGATTH